MMVDHYFGYHNFRFSVQPRFLSQPPDDLRKSNFFNFTIELRAGGELLEVQEPQFVNFLNENNGTEIRNGVKYRLRLRYPNDMMELKDMYLTLVDASTSEIIRYEGHDDNPKMKRVLLTHEAICTRCSLQKSCGNKNEAPSDPILVNKGVLKFFLKCNQNCLKGAGNPRDMRRFAIAVSFDDITNDNTKICALSNKIFVHNNSKHNRKRKRDVNVDIKPIIEPSEIAYVHPRVGQPESAFAFYSKEWSDESVSFRFNHIPLMITSIIPKVGMTVQLPVMLPHGTITITVYLNNVPVFSFPYEIQDGNQPESMRHGFLCLYRPTPVAEDFQMNVGSNNSMVYVSMPPAVPCGERFHNSACSFDRNNCHFSYPGPYFTGSTSPGSERNHLSGSDSSPPYMPSGGY